MPSQVKRLLLLFAIAAGLLVVFRVVLMPKTFGLYGHYRAAAADSIAQMGVRYAGHLVCQECHDDVAAIKNASLHAPVACEACHGPGYAHTQDPMENKLSMPKGRTRCGYCHNYDPSRPTGFPQINPAEHGGDEPCFSCHNPHEPEPPQGVGTCDACHSEIARTKSTSHHLSLRCATCHATPAKHMLDPRSMKPDKPRTRDFCGQCHAEDASAPANIPRIDLSAHGEDYLCWQCHYPHFPEARR